MEALRERLKNVELLRKFRGLVSRERKQFEVFIAPAGRVIGTYKSKKDALAVKAELNAQERFGGHRRRLYRVREL